MTSEEDWKKRLERLRDMLAGKNGNSQSQGTPRRPRKGGGNPLDGFSDTPKRDRGK